jgi:glutamate--cysteine ligase
MPTTDRSQALSMDQACEHAGKVAFPNPAAAAAPEGIGLEPEFFPIRRLGDGRPGSRVLLNGENGVFETLDGMAEADERVDSRVVENSGAEHYPIVGGGRLTLEPGAQVEFSTPVYPTVREAMDDMADVVARVRKAFARREVAMAAVGVDVWHDVETVPQQLRAGRYTAQAAYYRQRGHWGAIMMRHTASLQINLDLGPEGVWQDRWRIANLASPLLTATFACSPGLGAVCSRARAWQELDPTRSGFPRLFTDGAGDDPRAEWGQAALEADVMIYRAGNGCFEPGCPGCSFEKWINDGHPRLGWPTIEDLEYHLTTLFFEVRPRGFLELRAGEALPDQWRAVPITLMTTLLYDDRTRDEALSVLGDKRPELADIWRRAAVDGVRDPELRELACRVWQVALEGARNLPAGFVGDAELAACENFLEHFTARGRMPTDDLSDLLAEDPARSLEWASS